MNHQETLLGLLPPVSYARQARGHRVQAQIDARVLDEVGHSAQRAADGIHPERAGTLLTDWERVLGLDGNGRNHAARVSAVLIKINTIGGLSIPYFVQLAKSAGYDIRIEEPQPFRAGINRAGDRLAREDIMFVWRVHVQSRTQTVWHFRAGSGCAGERLSVYGDSIIETIFHDLKPAHTEVVFSYQD